MMVVFDPGVRHRIMVCVTPQRAVKLIEKDLPGLKRWTASS